MDASEDHELVSFPALLATALPPDKIRRSARPGGVVTNTAAAPTPLIPRTPPGGVPCGDFESRMPCFLDGEEVAGEACGEVEGEVRHGE